MDIFSKIRLRPSQLRTVAERRFADADALRRTGKNSHANGAIYLAGFVMECLLKAHLLVEYPWLRNAGSPQDRPKDEQRLWSLCYRSHELDEILEKLPKVAQTLTQLEQRGHMRLWRSLKSICEQWTVYARYSPSNADIDDASSFINQIKELKRWL